ncbi:hypothetical protein UA08_06955 [Talaromyces atroroseus]|uniref:DUF1760-domain-containing protein n=1 Tax=Talaromyces atroroseus TaxID=1441469 RepID=A0A225AT53_TALAT|nr:hypothetical protein UA08_06955 [Talaromyces atroroseus]OKL57595.1 hypothetical protein UA08_06955 [Talaromyces atroroseus]
MASESDDPLISALPPATDYLTYLTLLEYQLTPARLPTLHRLLQDEVLTTNIGWDLVQLLLPMLPHSRDCLQDIARLGNPREVILRVSDSLMKLEPSYESEDEDAEELEADLPDSNKQGNELPRHVTQFNCLISMLSVLHRRIKTKYPSRFIATSLQATLEAYSSMPTDETTSALLEFLWELSPSKRPALPPRGTSDSSVLRVSKASAPDPEAAYDEPTTAGDKQVQLKLIQFGLVEALKSYWLSLSTSDNSGLWLALRLLEKLDQQEGRSTDQRSKIHMYTQNGQLKERDLIIGKFCKALSRDLGITDEDMLRIVSTPAASHPPPLDFDELPNTPDAIPLERHGALLLLAARSSAALLFSGAETARVPVYPDLAVILSNFVGMPSTTRGVEEGQAQALHDALLALTAISSHGGIEQPTDQKQYSDLILALTACSSRQSYNALRNIPANIVHNNQSEIDRLGLMQEIFEKEELLYARESAVSWLKHEILAAAKKLHSGQTYNASAIFIDHHYISILFAALYNKIELDSLDMSTGLVFSWIRFSRSLAPYLHAALNLYYVIICSSQLRDKLKIGGTSHTSFRKEFLGPLKSVCNAFEADLTQNGGNGRIEAVVGEDMCQVGMARSVGLLYHIIEQVEAKLGDKTVSE